MNKKTLIYILVCTFLSSLFWSCLGDLDAEPLNDKKLLNVNVYKTAEGYRGVMAKCYGSLILNAQNGDSDQDMANLNSGYSGYTRALFYLQECTTDQILLQSGRSQDSRDLLYMKWSPSTQILQYSYYRLYMSIAYCNEFLRESTDDLLKERGLYDELKDEMVYYRAEARFIRAYCYSMICDLFGSGPFIDETMLTGTIPHQKSRQEIYDYAISELEDIQSALKTPGNNEYGRIDQVAAWFLLARNYLNAQTWVNKNEYENAYQYAKKVIESNVYPLASDYRHIFLADNNTCKEIIWALPQDHEKTQNSAGTNFIVKALVNGTMSNYYMTGIGARGWGNVRLKTQLVDMFDADDQIFYQNDSWGDNKKDKRAQFFTIDHTKETWKEDREFLEEFNNGYACIKWRNVTKDRQDLEEGGTTFVSIDYPMFRTADAYLMAAEAILRGASGTPDKALEYVNEIRDRAYLSGSYGSDASGRITLSELNLDFILDERARELYTESIRRTDLIRFDKYTKGYNWDWKGSDGSPNTYTGKDVDDKYKLFPIPQDEFTVNPNLTQNPDYK